MTKSQKRFVSECLTLLAELKLLGFDENKPINGGDVVERIATLWPGLKKATRELEL